MGNIFSKNKIGAKYPRIVFVMDVSGSMGWYRRCHVLQLAVTRIIEEIEDKSYVGVVLFDKNQETVHKVIQITNRSVRNRLISGVPAMARSGTDIGSGILWGVKALTDECIATEGATIFLGTDGEDMTGEDYVRRVLPTLLEAKVKLR